MAQFTYTRDSHDPSQIRYKIAHTEKRMLQLSIVLRNVSEELKDLTDLLGTYNQSNKDKVRQYWARVRAGEVSPPPSHVERIAKAEARKNGKAAKPEVTPEKDKLQELKHEIVRWLMSAPRDTPEEIAPLIPAPVSMVKKVRAQLVDAGKLISLEEKHQQEG
jgi:hypothetical protein